METFVVAANDAHDSILLTNESTITARFTMRFNGNISVNTQDLVEQIRAYEVAGQSDMPDYEKAYHYLMDYHSHDLPVSPSTWMHEPSLYLNSIGAGLCDDAASALKLIWNAMGYESRVWLLSGHVVSEVHTGERWQMYDADLRLVYYNDDGQVAGVEELAENPHLIYYPHVRFEQEDGTGTSHSWRTAGFYSSTENNAVCASCTTDLEERDLIFEIPAGGSLRVGELTPERELPNSDVKATSLGLVTVTIPANSTGTLDIPLVLYDITGAREDSIQVGQQTISLGADDAFEYFNSESTRSGFETITYKNNQEPIQVHYLFNKNLTQVLEQNTIGITHVDEVTDLRAEAESPLAKRWEFPTSDDTTQNYFDGNTQYIVEDDDVAALMHGERDFEISTRIKVDADDTVRRPLADSFRFTFEIDAQNRPYAYYRASDDRWVSVRGNALPTNEWVDLSLRYENGRMTLIVNGDAQASGAGKGLDRGYLVRDLRIGGSDHMGGLRFQGEMEELTIRAMVDHAHAWDTSVVSAPAATYGSAVDAFFAPAVDEAFAASAEPESNTDTLDDDGQTTGNEVAAFTQSYAAETEDIAADLDSDRKVTSLDFTILYFAFSSSFR